MLKLKLTFATIKYQNNTHNIIDDNDHQTRSPLSIIAANDGNGIRRNPTATIPTTVDAQTPPQTPAPTPATTNFPTKFPTDAPTSSATKSV